jgi:hypothetical protein
MIRAEFKRPAVRQMEIGWAEIGGAKMEEGVTIAKVPDWMQLKPEMMRHLIREHEKLGHTLTKRPPQKLWRTINRRDASLVMQLCQRTRKNWVSKYWLRKIGIFLEELSGLPFRR